MVIFQKPLVTVTESHQEPVGFHKSHFEVQTEPTRMLLISRPVARLLCWVTACGVWGARGTSNLLMCEPLFVCIMIATWSQRGTESLLIIWIYVMMVVPLKCSSLKESLFTPGLDTPPRPKWLQILTSIARITLMAWRVHFVLASKLPLCLPREPVMVLRGTWLRAKLQLLFSSPRSVKTSQPRRLYRLQFLFCWLMWLADLIKHGKTRRQSLISGARLDSRSRF